MSRAGTLRELGPPAAALGFVWLVLTFFGPFDGGISDVPVYLDYGRALNDGGLPYRDFQPEYPPLALLLFWLPTPLESRDVETYGELFALTLLPFAIAGQVATALLTAPGWPRRLAAWAPVAVLPWFGSLVTERFDVAPAALCMVALALVFYERPRAAFAVLAIGGALKLFPLLLVPVLAAWLVAREGSRAATGGIAVAAVTLALVCLPFIAFSPSGFADQFAFHLDRPVQIESTPASVLLAVADPRTTGLTAQDNAFRSQGLDGGPDAAIEALFALLAALALAAVCALAHLAAMRRRTDDQYDVLLIAALGGLLAAVALGKVLSPQFLLWLVGPLIAVALRGHWWIAAAGAAAIYLTTAAFPDHYPELLRQDTGAVLVEAGRNLLLVVTLAACLRTLAAAARSRLPAAAGPPSR